MFQYIFLKFNCYPSYIIKNGYLYISSLTFYIINYSYSIHILSPFL